MIRWRFLITRLVVIVVVLMLLRWGLGPVASFMTTRSLQTVTGAKVEIAKASVGLFPPRIHYTDVRIADPRGDKSLQDAFRADSVDLVIDGDALMHRRWVIREGRISGIQVGSDRASSGHFAVEPVSPSDTSPSFLSSLLGTAVDSLSDRAEDAVGDLETIRKSREIRTKWETTYADLTRRAGELEKQIRSIREGIKGIKNPYRDWPQLDRMVGQANQARQDLAVVRATIDALPEQLQADLLALQEAKRIDLEKVDAYVPGDLTSSENFGVDIVTDAVRQQIERVRSYLDSGRKLADYTVVAPSSERIRGVNFNFDDEPQPELMIRHCEVGGMLRADGQVYALTGILENLTPTPERLREPTKARLRLEGPETVRIEYLRDQRSGEGFDLITLHWPQMNSNPLQLGNDAHARLSVEGGNRELWVQIRTEGDRISGRLVSKQTGLTMKLATDPQYSEVVAVRSFRESLATVDRIEIDAQFEGTWRDLDFDLQCNLDQILQRASQQALAGQVDDAKAKLAAKIERTHYEQALDLQRWLSTQQSEARSLLAIADESIQELNQKVLDEVGNADAYLGKLRGAIRGAIR